MIVAITPKQWKQLLESIKVVESIQELETIMKLDFSNEGDRFTARDEIVRLFNRL